MKDLKNLNCLLPRTKELLLYLIDNCDFLTKECMGIRKIFEVSEAVVEGVTFKLFAVALIYIDDIDDDDISYLEPKEKISKTKIREFFEERI